VCSWGRHCEERSDEAIQAATADAPLDCFASLAMTSLDDLPAAQSLLCGV
jgi:hypothetical protein